MTDFNQILKEKNSGSIDEISSRIPTEGFELFKYIFDTYTFSFFQMNTSIPNRRITIPSAYGTVDTSDKYIELIDLIHGDNKFIEHNRLNGEWMDILTGHRRADEKRRYVLTLYIDELLSEAKKYMMLRELVQ
jgi:hypothetical protein